MQAFAGRIVSATLKLSRHLRNADPVVLQQERTLRALLKKAAGTGFGRHYGFGSIDRAQDRATLFRQQVPLHTYERMFAEWWSRALNDEPDVAWPGRVPYFGRSSGTAGYSSKHIPVTADMVASTNSVARKQMGYLHEFGLSPLTYQKQVLLLGSTTSLKKSGKHFEGDLSGICARHMPSWLSTFYYRPGREIVSVPEWNDRLDLIVKEAWKWDIGTICGIPSWVQILLQKIVVQYKLDNIHQLWPNFELYVHGGVAITNYRDPLEHLFGKKVACMETYMASEGSFGFQVQPGSGIRLVCDAGIYYEFIPFDEKNFDGEGNLKAGATTRCIGEVEEGVNYAIVLTTCAGAWRYLIGDVIRFTDASLAEILIVGRTKQFLDHCGEHVSVDNLTRAVNEAALSLGVHIGEFGVAAVKSGDLYAHHWFIGCNENVRAEAVGDLLDKTLCRLNDDYGVERKSAIKEVKVSIYPNAVFNGYLKWRGKEGDMNKFPRVLNGDAFKQWNRYLAGEVFSASLSSVGEEE